MHKRAKEQSCLVRGRSALKWAGKVGRSGIFRTDKSGLDVAQGRKKQKSGRHVIIEEAVLTDVKQLAGNIKVRIG